MGKLIKEALNWSEVWALLIPLVILLWKKDRTPYLKPVRIFIWVALAINLFIDIISNEKASLGIKKDDFLWNNNFLYNIGSLVRFFLFGWFFNFLHQRFMHRVKAVLPYIFLAFVLVNFIFFENFIPKGTETFSSILLATEAALLLFYCLQYFIYIIVEEKTVKVGQQPGFWVVTGLSMYVAVNFFIFLFYSTLSENSSQEKRDFAVALWNVHNIVFILFCILMGIQFARKNDR